MKRLLFIILLSCALVLGGCYARDTQQIGAAQDAADYSYYDREALEMSQTYEKPEALTASNIVASSVGGDTVGGYGGHKIIRNFSLTLETSAFDADLAAILEQAEAMGGYVQYSYLYGRKPEVYGDAGRSASLTLRIPAERVDAFVSAASGCGILVSKNENTEDVTESYFDIETRLRVYEAQLERLESILVNTDNLSDILQLESEIARVTIQIESLTTTLRRYDTLIEYATVSIQLNEATLKAGPAATATMGERISAGFQDSLRAVGNFLENALVWFVANLPALLLIAVIAAIVLGIFFGIRHRRRARRMPPNPEGERK